MNQCSEEKRYALMDSEHKKLLPDLLPVMQTRMQILQYIRLMQPIGRRNLSASLGMTERVLRSEVQVLKEQNLVHVASSGMTLTEEGTALVLALEDFMKEISGLKVLEKQLKETLDLDEVFVVPVIVMNRLGSNWRWAVLV